MKRFSARQLLAAAWVGTTMLTTVGLAMPAHAQQAEVVRQYDIPAGSLAEALSRFADQSDVQISYEGRLTEGRETTGLRGRFLPRDALLRLLSGTGLVGRGTNGGTVTIAPATVGRLELDPMRIQAVAYSNAADGAGASRDEQTARDASTIIVNGQQVDADKVTAVGPWGARDIADTPYSDSVMSNDQIQNTVARDLDQLYKMNPVVQATAPTSVFGYPSVTIRGFAQSVGIFDGLRLSSYTYGLSTEEIEKVEVMNGLSGFLYGPGNVGGVANYVLKRPTYERLTNVTVGNYGGSQYFAHADLGGKIDSAGTLAYRFNASYANGETSKDDQHLKKWLVSGAVDWNIASNLLFQVEAAHTYWHLDRADTRFYTAGLSGWPDAYDVSKTYTPAWTYNQTKSDRIGANLKYTLSEAVSVRTAYMHKIDTREFLIPYPIYKGTGWSMYSPTRALPYDTISDSAYVYVDASFDTGGIGHKLTVGGSWDTYRVNQYSPNYIAPLNPDGTPYVVPANVPLEDFLNLPEPSYTTERGPRYKANQATNTNVIIGDDVTFTDTLSALIGFNYSTIDTKAFNATGAATSSYKESALTPTVSIIYKPVSGLTTYASYMESLEAGTVVPDDENLYTNPGQIFSPMISRQYEVGAKYAFSDSLLLTSALFRIEKANSYTETDANNMTTISQDGRQVHQGVELTLTGKVADNLNVVVGGTLMDLSIQKASNAALKGKSPTGASPLLLKGSVDYGIPGIEGLTLSGGLYYNGYKYQDAANLNKIDDYLLVDLGIRYRTTALGKPVTFNLYASNLTNKGYWASVNQLGNPRNIAFSARAEF
ncbi:TonB-dependent receptor [Novosphingobium sp.]|uniref:TonB-dependent siderophore receptor n=1 Tax=Novosphingobium sp. TaxID=1874826 RepID=UPI0028A7828D|nr:TonB-dependent receptor [Novosphingobium sp.]